MKVVYTVLGLAIGIMWIVFIQKQILSSDNDAKTIQRPTAVVSVVQSNGTVSETIAVIPDPSPSHGLLDSWVTWTIVFLLIDLIQFVAARRSLKAIQRRTELSSSRKLELIENEDILFDLPLYFGLLGTVVGFCLIAHGFASSRDVSYISTIVGILFSAAMRYFLLRPIKRQLQENPANG